MNPYAAFDSRIDRNEYWDGPCIPCFDDAEDNRVAPSNFVGSHRNDRGSAPQNSEEPNLLESGYTYIARALNQIPATKRDQELNDFHGVADNQEEEKEYIAKHLHLFNVELEKIKEKRAYFIAKGQSKKYVSNSKFRLKFLRADQFDAKKAAARFVSHFERKLELFGKAKLTIDITLRDLQQEDIDYLKSGFQLLLSEKDSTGRSVICIYNSISYYVPLENRVRL